MGYKVLHKRTGFNGKHKIQDCREDTVYHVEGQPYAKLPVFKIIPVAGEGKVTILHQNLLLLFGGNIEGVLRTREIDKMSMKTQDWILAVSDDSVSGAKVVSTGPKPMDEGDAIWV